MKQPKTREQKYGTLVKIFDKGLWGLAAGFFMILLVIAFVGGSFADKYSANLNTIFNITTQEIVGDGVEYYGTEFYNKDGGGYDNQAMRENSLEVSRRAAAEGTVLLWNNDGALPLAANSKVSLFGAATQRYLIAGGGSGYVGINTDDTVRSKLEEAGMEVNPKLYSAYNLLKANYGYEVIGKEAKDKVGDDNYWEYRIREVPWSTLDTTAVGKVTDTVADYGDAAIMTINRYTSEDGDTNFVDTECFDNNYLDLSRDEYGVMQRLVEMRRSGQIGKVILLINTASPLQMKNIERLGVDACVWVGMGGSASFAQIADVLTGAIAPSGRLADTFAYDNYSSPVTENFGDYTFTPCGAVPATNKMTHNTKYLVYQEGIYMGYRYYETRYEDSVLGRGNADGTAGVKAGDGGWKYTDEVAFPFGYGLTYTSFGYDGFSVAKVKGTDDYDVSLRITNIGTERAGKDVLQVYLQKPYTEYDIKTGIEKSSVELVGFAKTDELAPGQSQTLTVTVKGEDLKTYDAYGKKTYILEAGEYYLSVGTDAHDALNNILAAKGATTADGMDRNGNAEFTYKITIDNDDFVKYSVSSATGYGITNRFDDADINLYAGTADQRITYLTRNDWQGTYPKAVSLSCTNEIMVRDMQYGMDVPVKDDDDIPVYDTVTAAGGRLNLAMLMDKSFDDPLWGDLLNQMTWSDQNKLLTYG